MKDRPRKVLGSVRARELGLSPIFTECIYSVDDCIRLIRAMHVELIAKGYVLNIHYLKTDYVRVAVMHIFTGRVVLDSTMEAHTFTIGAIVKANSIRGFIETLADPSQRTPEMEILETDKMAEEIGNEIVDMIMDTIEQHSYNYHIDGLKGLSARTAAKVLLEWVTPLIDPVQHPDNEHIICYKHGNKKLRFGIIRRDDELVPVWDYIEDERRHTIYEVSPFSGASVQITTADKNEVPAPVAGDRLLYAGGPFDFDAEYTNGKMLVYKDVASEQFIDIVSDSKTYWEAARLDAMQDLCYRLGEIVRMTIQVQRINDYEDKDTEDGYTGLVGMGKWKFTITTKQEGKDPVTCVAIRDEQGNYTYKDRASLPSTPFSFHNLASNLKNYIVFHTLYKTKTRPNNAHEEYTVQFELHRSLNGEFDVVGLEHDEEETSAEQAGKVNGSQESTEN